MNKKVKCIIHYKGKESYSEIKEISEQNESRIRLAKEVRERKGGDNHHEDQCVMIPDVIDKELHGLHITPCYKKFTLILANESTKPIAEQKTQQVNENEGRRLSSRQGSSIPAWVYPRECSICHKYKIQHKGQSIFPKKIATINAAQAIKSAAEKCNRDLFYEIKDLDLIAKEFKYHQTPCYKSFTKSNETTINPLNPPNQDNDNGNTIDTGDFESVTKCVKEQILMQNQAISMNVLHELYGLQTNDTRYRNKLKNRLQSAFPDQLCFLPTRTKSANIVISASAIDAHKNEIKRESSILEVADYLRNEIMIYSKNIPKLSWPPTHDELTADERVPPEALITFLTHLLRSDKHTVTRSENIRRLIDSYAADLIHGVTRGEIITAKHFLLALGLHSQTGQKKVVEINHKLGHCISYPLTCEIETAQARVAQIMAESSSILPLKPNYEGDKIITYFWVDNFDVNIERQTGGGAVNSTHLVAFQEPSYDSNICSPKINLQRTKKRTIKTYDDNLFIPSVDAKKEPSLCINAINTNEFDDTEFISNHFTWLILRKMNSFDQVVPTYSGWQVNNRIKSNRLQSVKKTVEMYLPPIESKVTDYSTIFQYMSYLQGLASDVNMPYVNITLDVGAAINAFKLIWNYEEDFKNIVIHLGDFHFMKENFKVLGRIVTGSGFEDIVYQAGVCTSGSLNGVLAGSHYNRCWFVNNIMSEAMERLLLARFIGESNLNVPDSLKDMASDPSMFEKTDDDSHVEFIQAYKNFFQSVKDGKFGKTARFWAYYIELMKEQKMARQAIQENNFGMRTHAWASWIPYYFSTNLFNYARYGSFYLEILKNLDQLYPGLKEMLSKCGLSVQAQEKYPHRTAVDQRGEQTINRDAKTAGVKYFAANHESVTKWCLNQPAQARNLNALNEMAGVRQTEMYKPLRPSQMIKSEEVVSKVVHVLEEEYVNPFGVQIDESNLFNLSSGVPVEDTVADDILSMTSEGEKMSEVFTRERIHERSTPFHDPIKKCKIKTFQSISKSIVVRNGNTMKTVDVNRNILGSLLAFSVKTGKAIDFEKALEFPLSPIPLSIANADGSRRQTSKSKLMQVIDSHMSQQTLRSNFKLPKDGVGTIVIDFIALIRTMVEIPSTFEEFAWKLIKSIPSGYPRVDIVADTYREISMKNAERDSRGSSSQIIIKSVQSKVPRDFKNFLTNGDNKTRMINLLFDYFSSNQAKVLNILRTSKLVLSKDNETRCITLSSVYVDDELTSNQEEADTKVILHCWDALLKDPNMSVILRSHSGDTDITVLAVGLLHEFQDRVFLDYGSGKNRKGCWLSNIKMSTSERAALIAFHAFTGNDYLSSFFRKGKSVCWKVMKQHVKFETAFKLLGTSWDLSEETFSMLEEFTCYLYGYKQKNVNEVRSKLFSKKYGYEHKVVDLSLLPPCQSVLKLHAERSNVVSMIWRKSLQPIINIPNLSEHGWLSDGKIRWIDTAFPDLIEEILLDPSFEDDFEIESDVESIDEESDD